MQQLGVCRSDGCLHEVYIESNGRYRRVFSTYTGDMRMGSEKGVLVIEVTGGSERNIPLG